MSQATMGHCVMIVVLPTAKPKMDVIHTVLVCLVRRAIGVKAVRRRVTMHVIMGVIRLLVSAIIVRLATMETIAKNYAPLSVMRTAVPHKERVRLAWITVTISPTAVNPVKQAASSAATWRLVIVMEGLVDANMVITEKNVIKSVLLTVTIRMAA